MNLTDLDEKKKKKVRLLCNQMIFISKMSGGARYDAFYIRDTLEIFLRSRSAYKTSQDFIVLPCDGTSNYFLQNMVLQEVLKSVGCF